MLNTKCELQNFPCVNVDYSPFNKISTTELKISIDVDSIVNHSKFCTLIPINKNLALDLLKPNDYLRALQGKIGVYHLWIDYDECDDHNKYTMLGVYVGKGLAKGRIMEHIKNKFPTADTLYISFYECENRLAKYIEQLFLDTYAFHLNKIENNGTENLYAVWDEERYIHGTQLHELANRYAKLIGPGPYEI